MKHTIIAQLAIITVLNLSCLSVQGAETRDQREGTPRLVRPDSQYDEVERMVRRPFSTPGYHTTLTGGLVHPTKDSIDYALRLLDGGRHEDLDRAIAVIDRMISLQDTNPENKTYGIWPWFLEEPLGKMNPPDWNWADFIGVSLLQISRDHRARLPAQLTDAVDQAILRACRSIRKRNVPPSYTNIAVLDAYVTLVTGEFYDLDEFKTDGLERLRRFYDFTVANGAFEEYNSPTYTVLALRELSRLQAHVQSPAARPMIDWLLRRVWEEIAIHFHAPTRQWAGPNSRAYSSLNSTSNLALIQRATAGRIDFGVREDGREPSRLPLACPPNSSLFSAPSRRRARLRKFLSNAQVPLARRTCTPDSRWAR
jgi:hypothetical protein